MQPCRMQPRCMQTRPMQNPMQHMQRAQVYDCDSTQKEIFDITARSIIDAVMDGYNGGQQLHR